MTQSRVTFLLATIFLGAVMVSSPIHADDTSGRNTLAAPNCMKIGSVSSLALKRVKGVRWMAPNRLAVNKGYKVKRIDNNRVEVVSAKTPSKASEEPTGQFGCGCEASGGSCGVSGSGSGCSISLSGSQIQCSETVCKTCEMWVVVNLPNSN